jgi:hypothetical protein
MKPKISSTNLLPTAAVLIGLVLYGLLLAFPIPKTIGLYFRSGFTLLFLVLGVLVFLALRWKNSWAQVAAVGVTLVIFALPLSGLWSSGMSESYVLGGILPFSDASSYYHDALALLHGWPIHTLALHRPMFSGLLASLLWVTGHNLQVSLAVLNALAALSSLLLVRQMQRQVGAAIAAFLFLFLFTYFRQRSGKAMTESLGFMLGTIAALLLLDSANRSSARSALGGLFFLSMALNARAGAFFVLPALLVWASLSISENRRGSALFFIAGAAAIAVGFVANFALLWLLSGTTSLFSNFSYTFYGLVVGGKGWTQAFTDLPQALALQEPAQSRMIFQIAFQSVRQHPQLLVQGLLRYYGLFFSTGGYSMFSFVGESDGAAATAVRLALYALMAIAIIDGIAKRRQPEHGLLLAVTAGILLSVPFAPPLDSYGMRVYAATIPLMGLIPAVGIDSLLRRISPHFSRFSQAARFGWQCRNTSAASSSSQSLVLPAAALGSLVLVATLVLPVILRMSIPRTALPPDTCPSEEMAAWIQFDAGSYLHILPADTNGQDWLPDVRLNFFKKYYHNIPLADMFEEFDQRLTAPSWIANTIDLKTGKPVLAIVKGSAVPPNRSILRLCGKFHESPEPFSNSAFFVSSYAVIQP